MKTMRILSDRITFEPLTSDPTTVTKGDVWYNVNRGGLLLAIDNNPANAKLFKPIPFTTDDLADNIITTEKIVDGAVTDSKIASGISPSKIATGDLNLGSGTLICGQIVVGDIILRYGWEIKEYEDRLEILKNDKVVFIIPAR